MSKGSKKYIGNKGEDIAVNFLKNKGYKLIQRNYRCRWGEIDILAEKDEVIYIVEVRTRCGRAYGTPADSISSKKLKKLKFLTLYYLNQFSQTKVFEIELISIILPNISNRFPINIKKYNITLEVMR